MSAEGPTSTWQYQPRPFVDPDTGATVRRLTPPGQNCQRNYFYQKAFTSDGQHLVLGSDAGGTLDFWLLELASGRARRLTSGHGEAVQGAYLSADDRSLYFTRGAQQHCRLDLATGTQDVVYQVPEGWLAYGTWSPNTACTKVAALLMHADDRVTEGSGWERFAAQFHAKPRQRLLEIDLATGLERLRWEERRYLGHPLFRPHDTLLSFCHEGPHDLVDSRVWFLDRGVPRPAKAQLPGEAVMHEFWAPDGERLYYMSYRRGEPHRHICSVDPKTLVHREWMIMPPCAHLMSNPQGTLLVGDGAGQLGDVADKDAHAFTPDPLLYLFDVEAGTHRALCGHHSSWKVYGGNTQASHPHPSFTPDGRQVLFASDFEGELALYLADLAPLPTRSPVLS